MAYIRSEDKGETCWENSPSGLKLQGAKLSREKSLAKVAPCCFRLGRIPPGRSKLQALISQNMNWPQVIGKKLYPKVGKLKFVDRQAMLSFTSTEPKCELPSRLLLPLPNVPSALTTSPSANAKSGTSNSWY
jgi:hypothetical protein